MKKLALILVLVFAIGSLGPIMAVHNDEFPTNGCDDEDHTINVTAEGDNLVFIIDGEENPTIEVDKDSCVKVVFDNKSNLDHDFTVVDDTVDPEEELIHMDTDAGTVTTHLWQMPDRDVELKYYCEVPGHQGDGMEGNIIIGDVGGFLPGFGLTTAIAGLLLMISIPILRRKA